ncbi:MAG: hypothetical protein R3D78_01205 [Paracoccaceae bacterium]
MPIDTMPSPQKEMIAAVNAFLTPLQKGKTPLSRALRLGDMAIIDADCSTDWPVVAGKAGKAFCAALPHPKPACYDWDSGTFYLGVEPKKLGAAEAPVLLAELFQALRALDGEPRPEPDNLRETLRNSAFLERALPIFPRIAKAEAALMKPPKTPTLAWVEALFALFDALEDFERAEYGKPPSGAADPAEYRPPDHEALYDCWRLKINFYALPQYYEAQKDKGSLRRNRHRLGRAERQHMARNPRFSKRVSGLSVARGREIPDRAGPRHERKGKGRPPAGKNRRDRAAGAGQGRRGAGDAHQPLYRRQDVSGRQTALGLLGGAAQGPGVRPGPFRP